MKNSDINSSKLKRPTKEKNKAKPLVRSKAAKTGQLIKMKGSNRIKRERIDKPMQSV
jgi:hypothetical protein